MHSRIPIVNFKRDARQGLFKSEDELIKRFSACVDDIQAALPEIIDIYQKSQSCQHPEWTKPFYTVRKMLFGYSTVYERTCKTCHKKEEVWDEKPDWTEGAKKQYYNNNF